MNRIGIVSSNFSIGHLSHMTALKKALEDDLNEVSLVLDSKYLQFLDKDYKCIVFEWGNEEIYNFDKVIIQNPSKSNIKYIQKLRKNNVEIQVIYIFHEPWTGIKNRLKGFSFKKTLKEYLAVVYNVFTLRKCDKVILPSTFAYNAYKKYHRRQCDNFDLQYLLFDKEEVAEQSIVKDCFSYIGTISKDHNFSGFIDMMIQLYDLKVYNGNFLIATKSDFDLSIIPDYIIRSGRLKIVKGRPLTNNEINTAYSSSFCVWLAYKRSTQSGVMAKAYMFNCYVLIYDLGSNLEFFNSNTSLVVNDDFKVELLSELYRKHTLGECRSIDIFDSYFDIYSNKKSIREKFEVK